MHYETLEMPDYIIIFWILILAVPLYLSILSDQWPYSPATWTLRLQLDLILRLQLDLILAVSLPDHTLQLPDSDPPAWPTPSSIPVSILPDHTLQLPDSDPPAGPASSWISVPEVLVLFNQKFLRIQGHLRLKFSRK